jgi:hypothetical protein
MPISHPVRSHGLSIVLAMSARLSMVDGDLAGAIVDGQDAYDAALATKDYPIIAMVGVALAEIAATGGRPALSAEMLGAAARLRGTDDPTSTEIARLLVALPAELGAEAFAERYDYGKGLDRAAAAQRLDPAEAFAGLV